MAVSTGNYIPFFTAGQGNLAYVTSAPTYTDAGAIAALANILDLQVIQCKNVTISVPVGSVQKIDLLGTESTTTGSGVVATGVFQNALMNESPWTNGKISGTLILTAHNDGTSPLLPDFFDLATGAGDVISTTYHRHTFGDSTAAQVRVLTGAILLNLDNSVQQATAVLNAPYVNLGELKPTGSDGHWEIDFEAECLPKDMVVEIKDKD